MPQNRITGPAKNDVVLSCIFASSRRCCVTHQLRSLPQGMKPMTGFDRKSLASFPLGSEPCPRLAARICSVLKHYFRMTTVQAERPASSLQVQSWKCKLFHLVFSPFGVSCRSFEERRSVSRPSEFPERKQRAAKGQTWIQRTKIDLARMYVCLLASRTGWVIIAERPLTYTRPHNL